MFRFTEDEGLIHVHTAPLLPADFTGHSSAADIHLSPDGRFVFASNRGHDSIAIFRLDASTGGLTPIGHEPTRGKTPRNFALSPSGDQLVVANQDSHSLVLFDVDKATGLLSFRSEVTSRSPVWVAFA